MSRKTKDNSRSKAYILLAIIIVWGLLAGIIFYLSSSFLDDKYPSRRNPFLLVEDTTCNDISLVFPENIPGVCYDEATTSIRIKVKTTGDASVTSLLITLIGAKSGEIVEKRDTFDTTYYTLRIPYNVSEYGDAQLIEIVPRYVIQGVEQQCESSKSVFDSIPEC